MKYFKVINFLKKDGNADYKGLDINQFVGMSQQYDFENGFCVIGTTQVGGISENSELFELDESEYLHIFDELNSRIPKQTQDEEIVDLKTRLAQSETDNITTLEALAEVYETVTPLLN